MARVLVIGATGGTGRRVLARLATRGHQAFGLYRRPESRDALVRLGATPVAGDLEVATVESLSTVCRGMDAVVFTAGANGGGDALTDAIDGRGLALAAEAALQVGTARFLLVSAFPDAWRDRRMPADFEHYMAVKRQADVALAATALDWVILRPGTLTDACWQEGVRLGPALVYGDTPRAALAAALVALVEQPAVNRIILELTEGSTDLDTALARAATYCGRPAQPGHH